MPINPIIQLAALGSLQIAMRMLEDFDPTRSLMEQVVQVPHPLLQGINRVPVLLPQVIDMNGIGVRCVIVTFSKADDDLKIDVNTPPNPVALIAQIVNPDGQKLIGINRWADDADMDEREVEFVMALEEVHENMLAAFGKGDLDPEIMATLQAA